MGTLMDMTKSVSKPQTTVALAAALLEQAVKLLAATPAASMPAERPASAAAKPPSPRMAKLLQALGVTADDLHAYRHAATSRGVRAVAARRAIVAMLAAEDASVAQIARETGLGESTVRAHMPR